MIPIRDKLLALPDDLDNTVPMDSMTGLPEERMELTPTQARVYDYMVDFFLENDHLPSSRSIQLKFEWQSQTAAMQNIVTLFRKGWLERNDVERYKFVRPIIHGAFPG